MTETTAQNSLKADGAQRAIVQVTDALDAGPVSRVALDLSAAIRRFGGTSCIISGGGSMVAEAERAQVIHETINMTTSSMMGSSTGKIASQLDEWQAQLVHSHGETPPFGSTSPWPKTACHALSAFTTCRCGGPPSCHVHRELSVERTSQNHTPNPL